MKILIKVQLKRTVSIKPVAVAVPKDVLGALNTIERPLRSVMKRKRKSMPQLRFVPP
jgi:hypothetical protein